MAAPIPASEIANLGSIEAQTTYLVTRLALTENRYNAANPDNTVERVTVAPNYDNNTVTCTIVLQLSTDAVGYSLIEGIQPYLP